jgi:hypothetical protein
MVVHRSGKRRLQRPVLDAWLEKDLFANDDKIPPITRACIVGSGPTAAARWAKLTGYTLFAMNSAITFPLNFAYWFTYDENSINQTWFKTVPAPSVTVVMGRSIADERAHYVINVRRRMADGLVYAKGELFNGATVAGVTAAWLEQHGCKEIAFYACEFFGPKNLDGSSAGGREGKWHTHVKWMNRLLATLRARGVLLYSLTPTMLDLPLKGDY